MLPRMRPPTAAPSSAGAGSPWPATAATRRGPGVDWTIPTPASRPRRSVRWPASVGSPPPTWPGLWATVQPAVRRRAVETALAVRGAGSRSTLLAAVTSALDDPDPLVVVGAAWFLAERRHRPAVPVLVATATGHADARCREAAVAALGAIGDTAGLPAVVAALDDKPTIRRRATVALAGFDDPRVEPALQTAAADRDWQVRQAAAELLAEPFG